MRHQDDGEARSEGPESGTHLVAGHYRQVRAGQHEIPDLGDGERQRDDRVRGVRDFEPAPLGEHVPEELGGIRVILDEENPTW